MFCKNCGAEIPDGSGFCTKCGKPVETLVSAGNPEEKKETIAAVLADLGSGQSVGDSGAKKSGKPKGLVAPIATLIASISGWIYFLYTNSMQGIKAWFTSSDELQSSVSQNYNYYGNNFSNDELMGNIVIIGVMVLFTLLGIVGVIVLIKRLIRKFVPGRRK